MIKCQVTTIGWAITKDGDIAVDGEMLIYPTRAEARQRRCPGESVKRVTITKD